MKQRNLLIDVLKGFTIILVVMGHASQWFSGDDRSNPFYVTIYAFHMPLFMFLSGYVCYNNRGEINLFKRYLTRLPQRNYLSQYSNRKTSHSAKEPC